MWMSWWWICLIVIYTPVNSQYLSGSLGNYEPQKILTLHDHSVCLSNIHHMSLSQTLIYSFRCWKFKVLHCLIKKNTGEYNKPRLQNSSYCGSIWLQEKPQTSHRRNIFVSVKGNHNIHLKILRFQFFLSRYISCHQHGMFLSYNVEIEKYCGVRMPWDIIVNGNHMWIHLSIKEYKDYSLQLYYSSFLPRWIVNISRILTIFCDVSSAFIAVEPYAFLNIFIKSYTYYVMSYPENYLLLHVSVNNLFTTHMMIYDGPGNLSRNIFEMDNSQLKVSRYIHTTAFLAFINIKLVDYNFKSSTNINITATYSKHKTAHCANFIEGLIRAKSNKWENMACMGTLSVHNHEIRIHFVVLTFIGPTMLTHQSDSVCQYGGLVVQFNSRNQQYEFCESLHNYTLYTSNQSFTFIVVWFSGYSQGELTASLSASKCRTSYAEFYLPKTALSLPNIFYRPHLSKHCEIFICPALHNQKQRTFTVQFGPHFLGTTVLSVRYLNTLSACDPEIKYDQGSEISIKSIALDNWPLHLKPNRSQSYHNITDNIVRKFDYLYMANVSFGYICKPEMTRIQMAVVFRQSGCERWGSADAFVFQPVTVNNIPSLHGICWATAFLFTPTSTDSEGYLNFIYKDTGHIEDGFDLTVGYYKCPQKCRNYRYSLLVKTVDDKTVHEYTTGVGQITYTGKYHRGFRLTILLPNKLCDQHLQCELQLDISQGRFRNVVQDTKYQQSAFHFHEKR